MRRTLLLQNLKIRFRPSPQIIFIQSPKYIAPEVALLMSVLRHVRNFHTQTHAVSFVSNMTYHISHSALKKTTKKKQKHKSPTSSLFPLWLLLIFFKFLFFLFTEASQLIGPKLWRVWFTFVLMGSWFLWQTEVNGFIESYLSIYVLVVYVKLRASGECYETVPRHFNFIRSSQVDRLWLEAAEKDLWQISGLQRSYLVVHKNTISTAMKVETTQKLHCYGCVLLYRSLHVTFSNHVLIQEPDFWSLLQWGLTDHA